MTQQFLLTLKERPRGIHLITQDILEALPSLPDAGILHLFIQHTSAGLAINENADRAVRNDLEKALNTLAPEIRGYEHIEEGPDDMPAHIKSVLVGSSLTIPITHQSLNMGAWQGIYLCEFRNYGSPRKIILSIIS